MSFCDGFGYLVFGFNSAGQGHFQYAAHSSASRYAHIVRPVCKPFLKIPFRGFRVFHRREPGQAPDEQYMAYRDWCAGDEFEKNFSGFLHVLLPSPHSGHLIVVMRLFTFREIFIEPAISVFGLIRHNCAVSKIFLLFVEKAFSNNYVYKKWCISCVSTITIPCIN